MTSGSRKRQRNRWMAPLFGVMFPAMALVLIALSVSSFMDAWRFMDESLVTQAQVLRFTEQPASRGKVYAPVFKFADPQGRIIKAQSIIALRDPGFTAGDMVRIRYLPSHPDTARPDRRGVIWLGTWCCSAFAVMFCLGAWLALLTWKEARQRRAAER